MLILYKLQVFIFNLDICIIQLNWRVLNEFTVIDNNGKIINLNID